MFPLSVGVIAEGEIWPPYPKTNERKSVAANAATDKIILQVCLLHGQNVQRFVIVSFTKMIKVQAYIIVGKLQFTEGELVAVRASLNLKAPVHPETQGCIYKKENVHSYATCKIYCTFILCE